MELAFRTGCVGLLLLLSLVEAAGGQTRRQMRTPQYDPTQEITISGTVMDIQHPAGRRFTGTHLMVQTDQGDFDVHAGPSWFLDQSNMTVSVGDQIQVTGSAYPAEGARVLIAREIAKEGTIVQLRDSQGFPLWSRASGAGQRGMGRGRGPGMMPRASGIYNTATETSLTGTVQEIESESSVPSREGVRVVLDTGTRDMPVMLGPSQFAPQQDLNLKEGDLIEVTGSRVEIDGVDMLVARAITKDGRRVELRDQQGRPVWQK